MAAIDRSQLMITYADKTAGSTVTPDDINQMKNKHNALLEQSFIIADLQQSTGQNAELPMSQAAITTELNKKLSAVDIVQTAGGQNDTAADKVPSQKAITEAVKGKLTTSVFNTYFEEV